MKKSKQYENAPKIFVIEEVADNIYSINFILRSLGYRVYPALSYRNFLKQLKEVSPEIVIVDMLIPRRGGFEAIRKVHRRFKKIPIVAIAADAMDGNIEEIVEAGAAEVLVKPYTVI